MDSNSTEGSSAIGQSAVANSEQYEVARPFFSYLLGMYLIVIGNYKYSFALLSGVTGDIEPNETISLVLFSG